MNSFLLLAAVTISTVIGDYFVKIASEKSNGLISSTFIIGAVLYGAPAIGWYFLMKSHSLAAIGVFYSASTILILAALGFFVFHESFGLRESVGITLAILSVVVMSYSAW